MLRRMVPVTSSLFFLANELERTSSLSRLGPVAQIDDWVGGNSTGVSVCASLWVGRECFEVYHECELRRLASEARLLLSQVVDRVGRFKVPPPLAAAFMYMYRLTGGSISGLLRSVPRQILLLGLPVLSGAATGRQLQFDKKSGAYHTSFNHQRSTKGPSQTQKCM